MKIAPNSTPPQRSTDTADPDADSAESASPSATESDRRSAGDGFADGPEESLAVRQNVLDALRKVMGTPFPPTAEAYAERERLIHSELLSLHPMTHSQMQVLRDIRSIGVDDVHVWHGSHVVVRDEGHLYGSWKGLGEATRRPSSHYREDATQQFEVAFLPLGALLFGKIDEVGTWFQMENSASAQTLAHAVDYLKHKLSGHWNIGPLGLSPHSEKRGTALVLPFRR